MQRGNAKMIKACSVIDPDVESDQVAKNVTKKASTQEAKQLYDDSDSQSNKDIRFNRRQP